MVLGCLLLLLLLNSYGFSLKATALAPTARIALADLPEKMSTVHL